MTHKSQSDTLLSLVTEENCQLFHDQHRKSHARFFAADHWETGAIRSDRFSLWLRRLYYMNQKKPIHAESLRKVVATLEASAQFDGPMMHLHNRVARDENIIWIDMADAKGRAIMLTSGAWCIEDNPPPIFRRYTHQSSLPEPNLGGDVRLLLPFLHTRDESQQLLILTHLISSLVPDIPHPLLHLSGQQGSRKSTVSRMLRLLVDPSKPALLSMPKGGELVQLLSHHYYPFFDNVSYISHDTSDELCRAVTGGGSSKRQLFTDDEDVICEFKRVIGINGINVTVTRPDLLHRSILVDLKSVEWGERKTEKEVWGAFMPLIPEILGGMLNVLATAMGMIENGKIQLQERPRMADYAEWACAITIALGYEQDQFLDAYNSNIAAQNEEALMNNPVGQAVVLFMAGKNAWQGEPSDLLEQMEQIAWHEKLDTRSRFWPKGAQALWPRLKEVETNLKEAGIALAHGIVSHGRRSISIQREKVEGCGGCDDVQNSDVPSLPQ